MGTLFFQVFSKLCGTAK